MLVLLVQVRIGDPEQLRTHLKLSTITGDEVGATSTLPEAAPLPAQPPRALLRRPPRLCRVRLLGFTGVPRS